MKHIIAGVSVLLAVWASIYMLNLDKEVNKMDKITQLIKSTAMEDKKIKVQAHPGSTTVNSAKEQKQSQKSEAEEKLKALREKAGNMAAFKVSPLYKKRCSSCHGVIGQGIIGPKIMGQSKESILKALHDFKSGKRKNYVMYGLLGNMDEKQLEELASEIATFEQKYKESQK